LALADSFAVFRGPILLIGNPASPDARRFHAFGRAVSAAMVLGTEVSPAPFQEAEAGRQSPCLALRVPPHQRLNNDNLNHGEFTSGERGNSEHDSGWPSNAFPLRTASLRAGLGDISTERLAYPRAPQLRHRPPAPRPATPPNWPNASSPSTVVGH
jgi:hypothetical protein